MHVLHSNGTNDLFSQHKNVKIEYFSWKYSIPISLVWWTMTQSTILKYIWHAYTNWFPYFGKYNDITDISWHKVTFLQFFHCIFQIMDFAGTISFKIVDCVIIYQNKDIGIEYFLKKVLFVFFFSKSFVPCECDPCPGLLISQQFHIKFRQIISLISFQLVYVVE